MPANIPNSLYWVHDWSPFLWEFAPGIGIRYYGLAYVLGFLTGYWMLCRYTRAGRSPLGNEQNADLLFALVLGVLLGGRLGYFLLYDPAIFIDRPMDLLRVWEGGMASHGGFIGVLCALIWFSRKSGSLLWTLTDLIVTITPPGLLLGRLANFINGELWGKVTDVPWAVIFPRSADPGTPSSLILPRHPSQLYEAFAEGLVPLVYLQVRFWLTPTVAKRPGQLSGEFLVLYAIGRIVCENFREPDRGISLIAGLSRGSFYSLFLLAAGAGFIFWAIRRERTQS
jgi:phosphatidylglycerol:prolipoprotein diacylglycerol transferase